jgi:hypothetical protein
MLLWNRTRGREIARRVHRPARTARRLLGLLARPPLAHGEALWLDPCGGIHTCALRQAIDAAFLDSAGRVLRVARAVPPWRLLLAPRGTRSVIEFPAGGAASLAPGDHVTGDDEEGLEP